MLLSSLRSPSKLLSGTTVNLVIFLPICFLLKILSYIHSEHQSLPITISMNTSDVSRRILFRICSKSVPIFLLFFCYDLLYANAYELLSYILRTNIHFRTPGHEFRCSERVVRNVVHPKRSLFKKRAVVGRSPTMPDLGYATT